MPAKIMQRLQNTNGLKNCDSQKISSDQITFEHSVLLPDIHIFI